MTKEQTPQDANEATMGAVALDRLVSLEWSEPSEPLAARPVERRVMPTFREWLEINRISMTASETVDCIFAAQRRGITVEKFLGYPGA